MPSPEPTSPPDAAAGSAHAELARGLLRAVIDQDFASTQDAWCGGGPVQHFPSIDLAVVAFAPGRAPVWANVLFSREHPQGVIAAIDATAGPVSNVRFDADLQNAKGDSIVWLPGSDWRQLPLQPLYGQGTRMVAPYPASLLKLLVAVGVGLAVDWQLVPAWPAALESMITLSDNDATTEMVALLHRVKLVDTLNARFASLGLPTLQLKGTQADGGWRNADGAGVGHIHMTAWDTARLLWLLDLHAAPPPWLPPGTSLLATSTCGHLLELLQRHRLDHVLSSTSLRGVPGWTAGLPGTPVFAHKTGHTDNYIADAGILREPGCHAIVALQSNLGRRYAPDPRCVTTWRIPALGGALHRLLRTTTRARGVHGGAANERMLAP
jgi:hypothetical protein